MYAYLHSRCFKQHVFLSTHYLVYSCMFMYEMGGTRGTLGRQKRYIQGFGGDTLGKRTFGRCRRRWDIKVDLQGVQWSG